jgi:hypothetical protein
MPSKEELQSLELKQHMPNPLNPTLDPMTMDPKQTMCVKVTVDL